MNRYILLTQKKTDDEVYVFVDHIEAIYPKISGSNLSGIGNNGGLVVRENPEQIIKLIEELN